MDDGLFFPAFKKLRNHKERNRAFDFLKLYAMLSVVLDHSLQHLISGNIQSTQLYNWIFLSQMPVFMFVSGYFSLKHLYKETSARGLLKKIFLIVLSYGVPFISYAILVSFITHKNIVFLSFLYPEYSLWFLWALMWMQININLAQYIIKLITKKTVYQIGFSIAIYFIGLLPCLILFLLIPFYFNTKLIIYYSFFFLFGYIYAYIEQRIKILNSFKFKIFTIPILIIIILIVMINHPTMIFDSENIINMFYRLLGSCAAVLLLLYISTFAIYNPIIKKISILGEFSLELYYVHLLVIRFKFFNDIVSSLGEFIAKYFLLVIISFILIVLMKSNRYTDFLFFGKLYDKDKKIKCSCRQNKN